MIPMLFLAAMAAGYPVEARVTAIDLQRPTGAAGSWYNGIHVELESTESASDPALPERRCSGDRAACR